ncbi:hypothetical protein [Acinetobacter wuhouensis]|uniref:Lipoprotein n=1 Tax=Acinetobacter wuhouensis TaxID=1879050 RepID=A0A4Q7AHE9_9GAMM|nr:hypothetical protein [Acinetobacter wuhouensis]RZG47302.1 hypothetical protein EXU28_06970 [Acinetobacter wuhouensis]
MKKLKKLIVLLGVSLLIACSEKSIYIEPEINGQLFDIKTNRPLSNQKGYVSFYLNDTSGDNIETKADGSFKVDPFIEKYYYFEPNLKELYPSTGQIYIKYNGYKLKNYEYVEKYVQQNPNSNQDNSTYKKVDVGIIYLEPEKK